MENYYGSNSLKTDTDGDGLDDFVEVILKLDPLKKDTDGNGILDSDEDYDNDRISNINELRLGTLAYLADSDMDELNDYFYKKVNI